MGKIQLPGLNQQNTALEKSSNLWHYKMINSDRNKGICCNKEGSYHRKLGTEKESA